MNELNALFRKRIGIPENETLSFEKLGKVLEQTALAIPFGFHYYKITPRKRVNLMKFKKSSSIILILPLTKTL
ncbi:hypothetical protein ACFO4N_12265 [Camelliibacillus cellulosilyticus]|uniref:Nitroreductase family protein n=1 Tax=Camelliibacillus cellulosilyticus TaxID=2174486 RepID=A0ABV9GN87_9BACL